MKLLNPFSAPPRHRPVAATGRLRFRNGSCVRGLKAVATLPVHPREAAFTMVEIALSLAVIGFALVAVIGILPIGMNVQKENRQEP